MHYIYLRGCLADNNTLNLPLSSSAIIFVLRYCQTDLFHINFVQSATEHDEVNTEIKDALTDRNVKANDIENAPSDDLVSIPVCAVSGLSHSFIILEDVPADVNNCALPVIQSAGNNLVRCGLCCCIRHIIKECHRKNPADNLHDLLGFRAGSLKACAEVSGWTKLCEVELPGSITELIKIWRTEKSISSVTIPEDIMKLELHFEKPPPLHNDDKVKRAIVKDIQLRKDCICDAQSDCDTTIKEFFQNNEEQKPHGSVRYRVITKTEKDRKKFDVFENDTVCKFGCSESKLVKGCAKCNDREKLRQKEKQIERNMARMTISKDSNNVKSLNTVTLERTDMCESLGISSLEDLGTYIDELTLNEIEYEHLYAEGMSMTVADLLLYTYLYHLLKSRPSLGGQLLSHLPHVRKWLQHLVTLPRIQLTSSCCGFKMADLEQCWKCESLYGSEKVHFSIPEVSLDVEEEENEISRRSRGKHKALKKEVARVLKITQEGNLKPTVGSHPKGSNVHVDWDTVPSGAHPRDELPEKRVGKKCEQLENLATAVESLARPGDVIVDFCSGGGHLGIIIAYLLPQCKVYLVENKEESLMRAKHRVDKLNMTNITLYQCNMGYFEGHFDIGVCLHACGVATDMVLQQCIQRNAAFVICPCCYGSIRNTHIITYPRSQCYRETTLSDKDVIILGHAADQTEFDAPLVSQGRLCMNLVDTDRALVAREHGYQVTLCSLQPLTCTPKNNLLIGQPPLWQLID